MTHVPDTIQQYVIQQQIWDREARRQDRSALVAEIGELRKILAILIRRNGGEVRIGDRDLRAIRDTAGSIQSWYDAANRQHVLTTELTA